MQRFSRKVDAAATRVLARGLRFTDCAQDALPLALGTRLGAAGGAAGSGATQQQQQQQEQREQREGERQLRHTLDQPLLELDAAFGDGGGGDDDGGDGDGDGDGESEVLVPPSPPSPSQPSELPFSSAHPALSTPNGQLLLRRMRKDLAELAAAPEAPRTVNLPWASLRAFAAASGGGEAGAARSELFPEAEVGAVEEQLRQLCGRLRRRAVELRGAIDADVALLEGVVPAACAMSEAEAEAEESGDALAAALHRGGQVQALRARDFQLGLCSSRGAADLSALTRRPEPESRSALGAAAASMLRCSQLSQALRALGLAQQLLSLLAELRRWEYAIVLLVWTAVRCYVSCPQRASD